jgi:hypothetical protein
MAKRFIDSTIWTQNQWFRKLNPKTKLFWIYLFTTCDNVGVWEEDFDLVSYIIGEPIIKEEVYKQLDGKIKIMSDKKIWLKGFCDVQYGYLDEEHPKNIPHQSYIKLLKFHSLWQDYAYPMDTLLKNIYRLKDKEKDIDKEKDTDTDKDSYGENDNFNPMDL